MKLSVFFPLVGGNYEEICSRLPTDAMIQKFLLKFLDDPSYNLLKTALAEGDIPTAFRAAHTLKGIGGSLGLGNLTTAAVALTEELRNATALPAEHFVQAVDSAYQEAVETILLLKSE